MNEAVQETSAPQKFTEMSNAQRFWRRFIKNRAGVVGTTIFLMVILVAISAPALAPNDPGQQNIVYRLMPPFWQDGGSMDFPLGTDQVGRCVLSRLIWGARISLFVGVSAVALGAVVGTSLGLTSGFVGGRTDSVIMTLVDTMLTFPALILAMAFAAVLGPGMGNIIIVLALVDWSRYARLVRGDTMVIKEREFVLAANAMGRTGPGIMWGHVLPNVMQSIIVVSTLRLAAVILMEASLSFLGLGTAGRIPSWGLMIAHGREVITLAWWLPTLPGLAILVTIISVNLFGDSVRDVFDPRVN